MRARYRLELEGQRFGRLTAIEPCKVGRDRGWRCRCDCGEVVEVRTGNLTAHLVTSCGCRRREVTAARNRARAA